MNKDILQKVHKRTIILSLFIIGICFFVFEDPKPIILGYIFGTLTSMLGFQLIYNTMTKAMTMVPESATSYTRKHYTYRLIMYAVVMAVAIFADYLNFVFVLVGLLMTKVVIYLSTVLDKNFL